MVPYHYGKEKHETKWNNLHYQTFFQMFCLQKRKHILFQNQHHDCLQMIISNGIKLTKYIFGLT